MDDVTAKQVFAIGLILLALGSHRRGRDPRSLARLADGASQ